MSPRPAGSSASSGSVASDCIYDLLDRLNIGSEPQEEGVGAAASPPPPPSQDAADAAVDVAGSPPAASPARPPAEADVVELLSSSSSSSSSDDDACSDSSGSCYVASESSAASSDDGWAISVPRSTRKAGAVIDSDSSSSDDEAAPAAPPPPAVAAAAAPVPPPRPRGAAPASSAAAWARARGALAAEAYAAYNARVFGGRLPAALQISWNARLLTTAGLTHYSRAPPPGGAGAPAYAARVELSTKVVDDASKLRRTLLHEMCHVAAWLLDGVAKPPHGPAFRRWAARAEAAVPGMEVTTCHAYEIFFAHRWRCTEDACGREYGRHSNSIDVARKVCGLCGARLLYLGKFARGGGGGGGGSAGGGARPARKPSGFSRYVQDEFAAAKARAAPGTPAKDIMRALGEKYRAEAAAAAAATAAAAGGGPKAAVAEAAPTSLAGAPAWSFPSPF